MTKKLIIISLLLFLIVSPTLATDKIEKAGVMPDSSFYTFEKFGESVKNIFTFGKEKKIERFINLAEERIIEAKEMLNKSKLELVGKILGSSEKLLKKAMNIAKKTEDEEIKKEWLDKIKIKLEETNNIKKELLIDLKSEEGKLNIKRDRLTLTDTTTPEYEDLPQYTIEEYDKDPKVIEATDKQDKAALENATLPDRGPDKTLNLNELGVTDTTTPAVLELKRETQIQEYGGKPGMEDGHGQVTRPEGVGSCDSKMYLCQIKCGQEIVEECVKHSGDHMYQLLSCRGACTKFNLFYGCGMEAGCDDSCWDNYYDHCGTGAYESCLNACKS